MYVTEDEDLAAWRETVHAFVDEAFGVEYYRDRYRAREYPTSSTTRWSSAAGWG